MDWRKFLKPIASLQVTVVLFSFSMLLVFFGTLAQKTNGLWSVVDRYFWSFFVMVDGQPILEFGKIFFSFPKEWVAKSWMTFPLPGGKLLGFLLMFNLLAAHLVRFRLDWKRAGVWMSHSGLVLLFVGEVITREFQIEQQMTINQGQTVDYAVDSRSFELAFRDQTDPTSERVTVIPAKMLERAAKKQTVIRNSELPVDIKVLSYFRNSTMTFTKYMQEPNTATTGVGLKVYCESAPEVTGVDQTNKNDKPACYVEFFKKDTDESLGVHLIAIALDDIPWKFDAVDAEGNPIKKPYMLELRNVHYYKPFSLTLDSFDFEQYVASDKAKKYRSNVTLRDPEMGVNRIHAISMNEPMRYRGETFYQHQFSQTPTMTQTVLQVVRNPGWVLPYVACGMVTIGLTFHFLLVLIRHLIKTYREINSLKEVLAKGLGVNSVGKTPAGPLWILKLGLPLACVIFLFMFFSSKAIRRSSPDKFDYHTAGKIPVVDRGRVKPLDTMARIYLRKISAREEYEGADGKMYPATKWLLDTLITPPSSNGPAWSAKVIRIDNDQVRAMMRLPHRSGSRYSLEEVSTQIELLQRAVDIAAPRKARGEQPPTEDVDKFVKGFFEKNDRDVFGAQALEVAEKIELYTRLCQHRELKILPPKGDLQWRSLGFYREEAATEIIEGSGLTPQQLKALTQEQRQRLNEHIEKTSKAGFSQDPYGPALMLVLGDYANRDPAAFNDSLKDYLILVDDTVPEKDWRRNGFEIFLNEFSPTYYVLYGYIFVLLISVVGWSLVLPAPNVAHAFRNAANWSLFLTILLHVFSLVARMYVMDRWFVFVTNLYSSAVWIGCSAAIVCWFAEWLKPLGVANVVGSFIGFTTSIIAHNLAATGDTLEMMEAVLDTNFWLATHVTTVTLGYAATYIAGLAAVVYVIFGVFTPFFQKDYRVVDGKAYARTNPVEDVFGKLIYGIICFATLLSFVGTVLGGIWADQSWGRFWGWDPKENGAVLIVIWNSLVLHARWCGLVKARGVAVLAIMGNMVTTWSWFGTNQLGVGLHAYGFNNQLVMVCLWVWSFSAAFIFLGTVIPRSLWVSSWCSKPPQGLRVIDDSSANGLASDYSGPLGPLDGLYANRGTVLFLSICCGVFGIILNAIAYGTGKRPESKYNAKLGLITNVGLIIFGFLYYLFFGVIAVLRK